VRSARVHAILARGVVCRTGASVRLSAEDEIAEGSEVFSLMRASDLLPDDYLTRFFDTGDERQGSIQTP
jgi:hypothetical protein